MGSFASNLKKGGIKAAASNGRKYRSFDSSQWCWIPGQNSTAKVSTTRTSFAQLRMFNKSPDAPDIPLDRSYRALVSCVGLSAGAAVEHIVKLSASLRRAVRFHD